MTSNLPVLLESILREAKSRGASDVLLVPGEPPAMRVDGLIQRIDAEPIAAEDLGDVVASVFRPDEASKIGTEVGELRKPVELAGEVNASLCAARSQGEFSIALRIMASGIPSVEDLHIPEGVLEAASSPNGLLVFSGLTGSGKMTTAYSVLDWINARSSCHICTVEEPVMARMTAKQALIQQREVGVDVPDAVSGIQAAVRQDVDVLLVGEVKSLDELHACLTPAATGHLVIIVTHSQTPEEAIRKIMDVTPEVSRREFAKVLRGVSAQRLLPRSDKPGRVPVFGVLIPDDEMRGEIAEGGDVLARNKSLPKGCHSIVDDIERLRADGIISEETAAKALGELQVKSATS